MSRQGATSLYMSLHPEIAEAREQLHSGKISEEQFRETYARVGSELTKRLFGNTDGETSMRPSRRRAARRIAQTASNHSTAKQEIIRESWTKDIDHEKLNGLMRSVGWPERTESEWKDSLEQSAAVFSLWSEQKLVAFGRLVENENNALLCDGVVSPEHQGQGLMSQLMKGAFEIIDKNGYSQVRLNAVPGTESMYEHLGWQPIMVREKGTPIQADEPLEHMDNSALIATLGRITDVLASRQTDIKAD